ncbi:putative S-adenosyl-L-methionine-dependent methyltransferase [Yersinia pseudotuberculosis]|nr:putative S-adenosyl-L-methionine-dependent methyltransferase [Yersinia pseudotuberculosis]
MRTPVHFATAIRELQKLASDGVINHYAIQADGSFTSDIMMIVAVRD